MTPGLRIALLWTLAIMIAFPVGMLLLLIDRYIRARRHPATHPHGDRHDAPRLPATNPFHTLEALGEHIEAVWYQLAAQGVVVRDLDENIPYPVGTVGYHLAAVEAYAHSLFQQMVPLLPDLYRLSEAPENDDLGDTGDWDDDPPYLPEDWVPEDDDDDEEDDDDD